MARFWSRFFLLTAVAALCSAAPPLTIIQDTLYKADGTRFDGIAQIQWASFRAADGTEVSAQVANLRITAGQLRVALVPTTNALQPVTYVVKFTSNGRVQFSEYWSVPPSTTPVRLSDVRTSSPAIGGSVGAITSVNVTDVTGLRSELDLRTVKGPGFISGRAAIINASGAIEAASGSVTDCVRVDGTSGPCGSGGSTSNGDLFIDSETPAGVIDGVNRAFTIASVPSPAASLNLYRNGVLLQQGVDYTLSGSTITIASGRAPLTGDRLQGWYRVSSSTSNNSDGEIPSGAVNGINATFSLAGNPLPAMSLRLYRNGLLMKSGLDYDLSVNTIVFRSGAIPQTSDVLLAFYRK